MAGVPGRCDLVRAGDKPAADRRRNRMPTCSICSGAIEGPRLADSETGTVFHPACAAERLPGDLVVALLALAATVLAPVVVVWGS
jgi:hypothetical protein